MTQSIFQLERNTEEKKRWRKWGNIKIGSLKLRENVAIKTSVLGF